MEEAHLGGVEGETGSDEAVASTKAQGEEALPTAEMATISRKWFR